jgi:two-component system cell cycle sensor histidine kinase/response regulator CckA
VVSSPSVKTASRSRRDPRSPGAGRARGAVRLAAFLAPAAAAAQETPAAAAEHRIAAIVMGIVLAGAIVAGVAAAVRERRRSATADAERSLLKARLDFFSRHANDMVFVVDERMRILDANDRAVETLGYSRGELLALRVHDVRDPATASDVEARVSQEIAREALVFETRYRRKDGSLFPVEVSVRMSEVDGHRLFHGIVRDLTDRKRAEDALRASEAKFRAAFDGAGVGIVLLGPDGCVREANPAFRGIVGLADDALRGRELSELAASGGEARDALRALLSGERDAVETPCRLRRADGTLADVVLRARAARDAGSRTGLSVALVEDVSERKRLETQLLLADRLASVGTLAAGVAHEINNPLAFVLANLDVALEALRDRGAPDDLLRTLEDAREGGARVREIVRDLKTFSRDAGGGRAAVDVRRILRSSANLAMPEIRRRGRLELDLAEVPFVLGAEHRLGQVFLNLLINAAQALPPSSPERNRVRAATRLREDGRVVVEVADTGSGIPPEIVGRIFDPFFTTKPVGVGTGLGLAIAHTIVTDLGGEIGVRSEPGHGTTFEVSLPAAPDATATPVPMAPAPSQVRIGRILVVDDEPLVARAVVRVLSPPHEVVSAGSGAEALAHVERGDRSFDVVLCDLMMPEMTGMEVHERLRAISPDLARRVVFLPGGAASERAREFLGRSRQPCVEKPFDPVALRRLVTSMLVG